MSRRPLDFYETPASATRTLLEEHDHLSAIGDRGTVLEPCHGDGAVTRELEAAGLRVVTNDINTATDSNYHFDATDRESWSHWFPDYVVTNPPFKQARQIFELAHERARYGVALLLRLTFLEPTEDRGELLCRLPPDELIVLPRISFTGDGKTDSVTCAWMIWHKVMRRRRIVVVPKSSVEQPRHVAERAS